MKTINGKAYAFAAPHQSRDIESIRVQDLIYSDHKTFSDWVLVGEATISVSLYSREEITSGLIASLRAQQQEIRAKAQASITALDDRINNLLAITNQLEEFA